MKLIAISTLSPQHQYVVAGIHKQRSLDCVIVPYWPSGTTVRAKWAKLVKSPLRTIGRKLRNEFYKKHAGRQARRVLQLLAASDDATSLVVPRRSIPNADINCEQTATLIRELAPDIIVTSGCPLLQPRIFNAARLATINVHWGIAPQYRGENTLFWPLYYEDYEQLGVTIHQIDEGIDTGPILAQGFPDISHDDTEVSVMAKCAVLATHLLLDVLAAIERTHVVKGLMGQGRGRVFLTRDRSFKHEVSYWLLRKLGRRTPSTVRGRRRIYIGEDVEPDPGYPQSQHNVEIIQNVSHP